MNKEILAGKWDELKGQAKVKWGKLTSDDLLVIKGKQEVLLGKLRERYGYSVDKANEEVSSFMKDCQCTEKSAEKVKAKKQPQL